MQIGSILLTLVLLPCSALAEQTIYKCKGADGVTVYSESPCGTDAKEVKATPDSSSSAQPLFDPTASPETRLTIVTTVFDSVAIDARRCKWELKVKSEYTKCNILMTQLKQSNSRWNSARLAFKDLLKDEDFGNANLTEMQRAADLMEESVNILQLYSERNR